MKRFLIAGVTVASMMCFAAVPAMANVLRPAGQTTGTPYAVESNAGSTQGQANRSTTGTTNKLTHDGFKEIWN